MHSLNTLGYLSGQGFEVTDQRPAGVKFNRVAPLGPIDQIIEITSQNVIVNPGIEILDIINYDTANVRYRITINTAGSPALVDSGVYWPGVSFNSFNFSVVGNVTTIGAITNADDWDYIKQFSWNLPTNYESCPCWSLECSILYYDEANDEERSVDWLVYDPDHYYVAQIDSTSTMVTVGDKCKLFEIHISSAFTPELKIRRALGGVASLSSSFTVYAFGDKNPTNLFSVSTLTAQPYDFTKADSTLSSISTLTAQPYDFTKASAALTSNASISANVGNIKKFKSNLTVVSNFAPTTLNGVTNMVLNRTYDTNIVMAEFLGGMVIDDTDGSFTITLESNIGKFSNSQYTVPTNSWTYTGTLSQVNSIFGSIIFYPNVGTTSNGNIVYTQSKNGITQFAISINLTHSNLSLTPETHTFTLSDTWQPTYDHVYYNRLADVLIVGGGGGGCSGDKDGCGGGGGGVVELINQPLSFSNYSIVVGHGGAGENTKYPNDSRDFISQGGQGGSSSAFGSTAIGGYGGFWQHIYSTNTYASTGGRSGQPQYKAGSIGSPSHYGGGGGGAGSVATAGSLSSYTGGGGGSGYLSTITNEYYGGGGGGGGHYSGGGGSGGGGSGGDYNNYDGENGENGRGGGGGGCAGNYLSGGVLWGPTGTAGNGGSGVVIIKIHT